MKDFPPAAVRFHVSRVRGREPGGGNPVWGERRIKPVPLRRGAERGVRRGSAPRLPAPPCSAAVLSCRELVRAPQPLSFLTLGGWGLSLLFQGGQRSSAALPRSSAPGPQQRTSCALPG